VRERERKKKANRKKIDQSTLIIFFFCFTFGYFRCILKIHLSSKRRKKTADENFSNKCKLRSNFSLCTNRFSSSL